MGLEKINLNDLDSKPNKIYVKLKEGFLTNLLKKASKNKKPHRDKDFCKKIKVNFNNKIKASPTVIAWIRFNRAIPLSKLTIIVKKAGKKGKEIEKNVTSLQQSSAGEKVVINFPININQEIGSIVGHILGDGSIDRKYQQVFYSNSNKELIKEFSSNMEKLFRIKARIWMQRTANFDGKTRWEKRLTRINELEKGKNCGLFYPSICGIILNNIFSNFAIGKDKEITNEFKKTNKDFKKGLIRAFYDDESTVGQKNIRVFQDRKNILENIRKFLLEFDVYPAEIKKYSKKDKNRYYFDIYRKSNLIKFRNQIEFTSSKKMKKLTEISIIKRPTMSK